MATIYQCQYKYNGSPTPACGAMNQGKRSKCRGCRSELRVIDGHAVVIAHRGDGDYHMVDAIKEYTSLASAEKAAQHAYELDSRSNVVARFLT